MWLKQTKTTTGYNYHQSSSHNKKTKGEINIMNR